MRFRGANYIACMQARTGRSGPTRLQKWCFLTLKSLWSHGKISKTKKKNCKAWIYMGRAYVYKWTTSVRKLRRNATQKCSFVPKCTLGQFFFLLLTASYQLFFLDAKHPSRAELHPYLYHPVFSFCYSCLFFSVNFSRKVVGLFLFIRMINFKIY